MMMRGFIIRFLENFLCAGSSALLISGAHLYPEFWFVSLFALIPFLWRAIRVSLFESIILGGLLATSYSFVALRSELWATPGALLFTLVGLNALFALYGTIVNRIKKHLGFNVIFIAALWLPVEYALSHYAGLESFFASSPDKTGWPVKTGLPVLLRIGSLFGLLMISFIIVLVNSLILIIIRQAAQALLSGGRFPIRDDKRPYPPFKEILLERHWYYFPDVRAPPRMSSRS
jgi:hypothetical protein